MAKTKIEIIFEDDETLVINKPSGTSVTKDRSKMAQLTDLLARQLPDEVVSNLRLIHRLDKLTSGVMILAKTLEAQRKYTAMFEQKLVQKTYLAIVSGFPLDDAGTIKAMIGPDSKKPGQMRITEKKAKEAETNWRLLANFGAVCLLAVEPITGRTHQIRLHLPSIGLPLTIDPLYGSSRGIMLSEYKSNYHLGKWQKEKPLLERLTLHAYQLEFKEAPAGTPDHFIAPLDKKFKACIKMLTRHNPKGIDAFTNSNDFEAIINAQRLDITKRGQTPFR